MATAPIVSRAPAPRLDREARIESILTAARDLFQDRGFDAVSMFEIAGRVGVVEGLIYKYFPTKRELLLAVLGRWYEHLFGDHTREVARLQGARARLQELIRRHLMAVRDAPRLCRLMFREVQSERDYHGTQLQALNRRYTQLLIDVIEAGQASGEFRRDLPASLLRSMIYGGIEHHSFNYVWGRGSLDVDRLTAQISVLICDGLNTPMPEPRASS